MQSLELWAVCHSCRHKHSLKSEPQGAFGYWQDWLAKHPGHDIDLLGTRKNQRAWKGYRHNADVKEAYASSAAYTISLASGPLATDANLLAGRESTAISNTTNKYKEYLVGGKITAGTSPTAGKTIEVWLYASVDDTPTYPDSFTGSDSNRSATSTNVKNAALVLLQRIFIDSTSSRAYWFGPVGIKRFFGGRIPKNHGLWVVHDTAVNLHSTGGNHVLSYTGHYDTVA